MKEKKGWAWQIVNNRKWILIVTLVMTVFFAYGMTRLTFRVQLGDLLPPVHPFVKINSHYTQKFGGTGNFLVSIHAKNGDIFKADILKTIGEVTDEVLFRPDVYRSVVTSIALNKAKSIESLGGSEVEINALMFPESPSEPKDIAILKNKILNTNAALYKGVYVADDGTSTLIFAVAHDGADYSALFKFLRGVKEKYEKKNPNIEISMVGYPILMGWIYNYMPQILLIFLVTLGLFLAILSVSYRSMVGMMMPLACGLLSSVWGLGFIGYMGYNLDPLLIVIPFLIGARSISHGVQITSRYIDEYIRTSNGEEAAVETIDNMLVANGTAIAAEIAGFMALVLARIVSIQVMALTMSFWMFSVFIISGLFTPVACMYLPVPVKRREIGKIDIIDKMVSKVSMFACGVKGRWIVFASLAALTVVLGYYSLKIQVGDLSPGSPVLWPKSEYNKESELINSQYSRSGTETYSVFIAGKEPGASKRWEVFRWIDRYDDYMREKMPGKYGGTLSFAAMVKKLSMEFRGGDPKWQYIPADQVTVDQLVFLLIGKANPGDYAGMIDIPIQESQMIGFMRDHLPSTVNAAINNTNEFIKKVPPPKNVEIKLAGGSIGLAKAVNDELELSYWRIMAGVLLFIFILCVVAFKSVLAAVLLVLPLFVARAIVFSLLYFLNIGETVASLTVMAIGLGIGVDFGIYILARMQEEYIREQDLQKAVLIGMGTAGKSVLYTAITVIVPVALWYFLSDVRFWGEMGLFLSTLLLVSLLVVWVFFPAIVTTLKPKFITTLK